MFIQYNGILASMKEDSKKMTEDNLHLKFLRRLAKDSTSSKPSKHLGLGICYQSMAEIISSMCKRSASIKSGFFSVPVSFKNSGVWYTEYRAIQVVNNHHTTAQQIERILLHVVCFTQFENLIVNHNRYKFDFGKMNTKLLQLLITGILDSKSKRINYSWISQLQEVIINYELGSTKKKTNKKASIVAHGPDDYPMPEDMLLGNSRNRGSFRTAAKRIAELTGKKKSPSLGTLIDKITAKPADRITYSRPGPKSIPVYTPSPEILNEALRRGMGDDLITKIAKETPSHRDFLLKVERLLMFSSQYDPTVYNNVTPDVKLETTGTSFADLDIRALEYRYAPTEGQLKSMAELEKIKPTEEATKQQPIENDINRFGLVSDFDEDKF